MVVATVNDLQFLTGGGEMGELIRAKDWTKTSLGDPKDWPQSLRTMVSVMLDNPFGMYIAWGTEYTQLYNDGYRPILGSTKHPQALGISTRETFAEIWHIIESMFEGVMNGKAVGFPDFMLPLNRNGFVEECYFDFSYSPIRKEDGEVGGVLVTVIETTNKKKAEDELKESDLRFRNTVKQAPVGITILRGEEFMVEMANEAYLHLLDRKENEFVGRPIFDSLPEVKETVLPLLNKVLHTGEPYHGIEYPIPVNRHGKMEVSYFNFLYHPLKEDDGKISGIIVTVTEVSEQVNFRMKIEESEKRFRMLADSMPQHIWTSNPEGNLNYYNKSVLDYSGLTLEQINKDGWIQIVHPDDREENIKQWIKAIETGKDFLIEHRFRRHDGVYRWQLSRAIPQKDEQGRIQMWVGTSTDIQDIKELDQQKDNFLSMASHELKTPVTTIKAYGQIAEAMLEKKGDTETLAMVSKMGTQVNKLTNLIGDLLDITRIQNGKLHYHESFFNLNEVVKEVVDDMQRASATHRIQNNAGDVVKIYGDKEKISQVLNNLISNAIKYSPAADKIIVSTQLKDNGVELSVKDFGIGIPAKEQQHVFEQFYRVTGNNQSTFPGMGIGLFICSEITKMHGGKIWADSVMGGGSTFHIWLPFDHRENKLSS